MEKLWCGSKGKALKGANTIFVQDSQSNTIICLFKENIVKKKFFRMYSMIEMIELLNFIKYLKNEDKKKFDRGSIFKKY